MIGRLPTASEWAARVADACDGIADLTGDARFRRASGVLRGKPMGRRPVDDAQALELARSFIAAGLARSPTDAARRAAVLTSPPHQIESTVRRLLKKLCDEKLKSQDVKGSGG